MASPRVPLVDSLVRSLRRPPRAPVMRLRLSLRHPLLRRVVLLARSPVLFPLRSRVVSLRASPLRPLANLHRSHRVSPRDSLRVHLHRQLASLQASRVDSPRGLLPT